MTSSGAVFTFVILLYLSTLVIQAEKETVSFIATVKSAKLKIDEILKAIHSKWKVDEYSNFLNSAAMTRTAWEVLKVRLVLHVSVMIILYFVYDLY